jgi:phosphoribosylformylglycinamidine synthase
VFHGEETVGEIPARYLTEDAPRYEIPQQPRELEPPAPPPQEVPETQQVLLDLLGSDNIRSRRWIYERYDHIVGSRTVRRPGLDGALLRLRPSLRGLAVSLDATGRQGRLDPRFGGAAAVFEAARNVACAGGEPLAVTDCLNYGNPEKPEIAWELAQGIEGIRDACLALGIPVVSGNVSLYNETGGRPIYPTPSVGCVGLVQDVRHAPAAWRDGDAIFLAGAPLLGFDGSEYQARYDRLRGCPPELDLAAEAALVAFLWRNAARLSLAHDASTGGLAVALAEAALFSGVGAQLDLTDDHRALFGEGGGHAVVACAPSEADALERGTVPLKRIGTVGGDAILGLPLDALAKAWHPVGEA